jgi:glycosyltransferase involved in cell wall biosynthesis
MKIAVLCPTFFNYSGIDKMAYQQASELSVNGDEVTIFTLQSAMQPPPNVNIKVIGMPGQFLRQKIYRLFFPLDIIKSNKWVPLLKGFDVIYSHQYPMNWLAYLAKERYGTKYIYYDYGYAPSSTFNGLMEKIYMKLITLPANWTIKKADGAISISKYLQRELKKDTGLTSEVSYCKIDTQRFHPGIDGSLIRARYNLVNIPMILFVGRISPHKGVHLLVDAFKIVRQRIPQARLVIVGKHSLESYSRKLSKMSNDSVIFAGDVTDDELPGYYAACDVYATATLWEGFDLPVAEAQACGKLVVAFNIGPHPEVIITGKSGKLVPVGDIVAMADSIVAFLRKTSGVTP